MADTSVFTQRVQDLLELIEASPDDHLRVAAIELREILSGDGSSYNFKVAWDVEVEAETAIEAALIARSWQLDPDTLATCFTVDDYRLPKPRHYVIDVKPDDDHGPTIVREDPLN